MKTPWWILSLLAGLVLHAPSDALASADGPDYYAVTGVSADDVLNIRAEPSAKGEKLGEIPHDGRGIQNLGCKGGPTFAEWEKMSDDERQQAEKRRWCKIRYDGIEGWVAGWFLTEDSGRPAEREDTSQ